MGKYRSWLWVSSQNHNILYFRFKLVTQCFIFGTLAVENRREPRRPRVRRVRRADFPPTLGRKALNGETLALFAGYAPERAPSKAEIGLWLWTAVGDVDNAPNLGIACVPH